MMAVSALRTIPTLDSPLLGQLPLPFPDQSPVVPAPVERDDLSGSAILRQKAAHFMQALVEVLSGERPARQLAAWMSTDVYEQLIRRLTVHSARSRPAGSLRSGRRARVVSVHVSLVDQQRAELAGRFVHRGRSRAIAVRLELQRNHRGITQWLCTAVVWG
jgi:hypothetical protein